MSTQIEQEPERARLLLVFLLQEASADSLEPLHPARSHYLAGTDTTSLRLAAQTSIS